jgi:acetyltransferase
MREFFDPHSIAVIGASRDPTSVGAAVIENLNSFKGTVYLVNPNVNSIRGKKVYSNVNSIRGDIALAIIAVPAHVVATVLRDCGKKGIRSVIIISAGFSESGNVSLEKQIMRTAELFNIRIIGPNCLGVITPKLNASFAPSSPKKGSICFISQSGALIDGVIDWSFKENIGFSAMVSVGNALDLQIADFIDYFGKRKSTKVITVYLESLKDGKEFMNAVRRCRKPVIILKPGKTEEGNIATKSHTGALAGDYEVYQAAFKQAGAIMVDSIEEMFSVAKTISMVPKPKSNAFAVVSNAGGPSVLAADYCSEYGVKLVELKELTLRVLEAHMHPAYSRANPLDIIGDADEVRYEKAVKTLLAEPYVSGLWVILTPQHMTPVRMIAKKLIRLQKIYKKPIICSFIGSRHIDDEIKRLEEHGIPNFTEPKLAALSLSKLV